MSGWNQVRNYILYNSLLNNPNGISNLKTDLGFLSTHRHLKIVRMDVIDRLDSAMWEGYKSQVQDTLLNLQRDDKEEKMIVHTIHSQPKTVITLPWPPMSRL
jgi:hypothetical protein